MYIIIVLKRMNKFICIIEICSFSTHCDFSVAFSSKLADSYLKLSHILIFLSVGLFHRSTSFEIQRRRVGYCVYGIFRSFTRTNRCLSNIGLIAEINNKELYRAYVL